MSSQVHETSSEHDAKEGGNSVDLWQPIETAPYDDEPVLIYDGNMVCSARRVKGHRKWWWTTHGATGYECEPDFDEPTHWQPLPAPPK